MICEGCGCSQSRPCMDDETGEPCFWVEPGLCSACAPEEAPVDPSPVFQRPPSGRFPTFRPRQVA